MIEEERFGLTRKQVCGLPDDIYDGDVTAMAIAIDWSTEALDQPSKFVAELIAKIRRYHSREQPTDVLLVNLWVGELRRRLINIWDIASD